MLYSGRHCSTPFGSEYPFSGVSRILHWGGGATSYHALFINHIVCSMYVHFKAYMYSGEKPVDEVLTTTSIAHLAMTQLTHTAHRHFTKIMNNLLDMA